jgi:trigger factor
MKISVLKLPKSQIELTVEIPAEDLEFYMEKALSNLAKNLELKGFRKGFVPKEMAKDKISEQALLEEAANLAINETYQKAIEEQKFDVIDSPRVELTKIALKNPLIYKITISVLPEIKLPDFKKIAKDVNSEAKKHFEKNTKVEDKDLEDAINWLQKSRAKQVTVAREARLGDFVKVSSKIKNQGLSIGPAEEHEGVIGGGYFLPEFEKKLVGMKVGEQKSFSQEVPEKHINKDFAGKSLDFEIEMKVVQEIELPKADDEFAKGVGNFENMEALKKSVKEGIKTEKEEKEKQKTRQRLMDAIVRDIEAEVPEILVDRKTEEELLRLKDAIEGSGLNFQDYLTNLKKSEDDLKKEIRTNAQNQVKIGLVLRQIARQENVMAPQSEIEEKVNEYLKRFESVEGTTKIDPEHLKAYYEDVIKNEKTFQLLEQL